MTKETITIAALRLFWLRGYKYVSLVDVANELGITKGGIYHYFSSKEELLREAVYYMFERFEAKYAELFSDAKSLQETISSVIVARELERYTKDLLGIVQGEHRMNHASFALEVMQTCPDAQERIKHTHQRCYQVIEQRIVAAVNTGEIKADINSRALAAIIFAILNGQHATGEQLDSAGIREEMADTIWKMVSA